MGVESFHAHCTCPRGTSVVAVSLPNLVVGLTKRLVTVRCYGLPPLVSRGCSRLENVPPARFLFFRQNLAAFRAVVWGSFSLA